MDGIAVHWREFPDELVEQFQLSGRAIQRGQSPDREYRFLYRERRPLLPCWVGSQLRVCEWGNRDGGSTRLPRSAGCLATMVASGQWAWMSPEPVEVPACYGLQRGVWYQVRQGFRGVLVQDERGREHVYLLTQPASHYYQVMTRSEWMPVLIEEAI